MSTSAPKKKAIVGSALASAIVTSALVGGVAWAAIPDESGTIHGCRHNITKALTVRDPAVQQRCPLGTTELPFSQTGPAGPQGPQGPQGETGRPGQGYSTEHVGQIITIERGASGASARVFCRDNSGTMLSGGYSFDDPLFGGSHIGPGNAEAPKNINVEMSRPHIGILGARQSYLLKLSFDPYNPTSGGGQTYLNVMGVCAIPAS